MKDSGYDPRHVPVVRPGAPVAAVSDATPATPPAMRIASGH
jgi:hypothetical protein